MFKIKNMNKELKIKKLSWVFCTVAILQFFGCQTIDPISQTDLSDYGLRHYDSDIMRFTNIDPQAEKYQSISPYEFSTKKPIYIDLRGDSLSNALFIQSLRVSNSEEINKQSEPKTVTND